MTDTGEVNEHQIWFTLGRLEWARTEWPAVFFWGTFPAISLLSIVLAVLHSSPWWALLFLPWWWPFGGRKASGILALLLRGRRIGIHVRADGVIFVSENNADPRDFHWVAFVDFGKSYVLCDGRYRLVIPRRALTSADHSVLRERAGVDLTSLRPGQEVRIAAVAASGMSRDLTPARVPVKVAPHNLVAESEFRTGKDLPRSRARVWRAVH